MSSTVEMTQGALSALSISYSVKHWNHAIRFSKLAWGNVLILGSWIKAQPLTHTWLGFFFLCFLTF